MADFYIQANRPELQQMFRQNGPIQPRLERPGEMTPPGEITPEIGGRQEISFRESIKNFIHDVDDMQKDAGEKVKQFMAGEISNVHDVMMAVEKAGTSFQLLMELRNKMLDAYQEIKRMSV
jgi:flagellar hook-basal body complex protein FliE